VAEVVEMDDATQGRVQAGRACCQQPHVVIPVHLQVQNSETETRLPLSAYMGPPTGLGRTMWKAQGMGGYLIDE
jgi:hypothetical protein